MDLYIIKLSFKLVLRPNKQPKIFINFLKLHANIYLNTKIKFKARVINSPSSNNIGILKINFKTKSTGLCK